MRSAIQRFNERHVIIPPVDCWIWVGEYGGNNDYGRLSVGGAKVGAHRFSFATFKGPIPRGYDVHHKCNTPACVNPGHLDAIPAYCNLKLRRYARRCKKCDGRLRRLKRGGRYCRKCHRDYMRDWRADKRKRQQERVTQ